RRWNQPTCAYAWQNKANSALPKKHLHLSRSVWMSWRKTCTSPAASVWKLCAPLCKSTPPKFPLARSSPIWQPPANSLTPGEKLLLSAASAALDRKNAALREKEATITAASPQNALDRGFALVRRPDGKLARNAAELPAGTTLHIRLAEGEIGARVL
ncbi:MAG: hypothetical protein IJ985_01165, partial [Akkermansia sp.]|nr:hypothetical protein [Akkermansia sp.]